MVVAGETQIAWQRWSCQSNHQRILELRRPKASPIITSKRTLLL
ncbi:hypothetical protein [Synechococcus sp. M16CYN]